MPLTPDQLEILDRWIHSIVTARLARASLSVLPGDGQDVLDAEAAEREARKAMQKAMKR